MSFFVLMNRHKELNMKSLFESFDDDIEIYRRPSVHTAPHKGGYGYDRI